MEKDLERKLVKAVRDSGGLALKFVSPGMAGVPDRLLLFPEGRVAFVEVKAPGEKPRPLQVHRMEQLRALGFRVYVADSPDRIEEIISGCHPERGSPSEQIGPIVKGERSEISTT